MIKKRDYKKLLMYFACLMILILITGCVGNKKELYKMSIEEYIPIQDTLYYKKEFVDNSTNPPSNVSLFITLDKGCFCTFTRNTKNNEWSRKEQSFENDCHYYLKDGKIKFIMNAQYMEWLNSNSKTFTKNYHEILTFEGTRSDDLLDMSLFINNQEIQLDNSDYVGLKEKNISEVLYNPETELVYDLNGNSAYDYEAATGKVGLNKINLSDYKINNERRNSNLKNKFCANGLPYDVYNNKKNNNEKNIIKKISMDIYLDKKGNAHITEVWDTYLVNNPKLCLSKKNENQRTTKLTDINVTDDNGSNLYNEEENEYLGFCWNIKEYGENKYTIKYTQNNYVYNQSLEVLNGNGYVTVESQVIDPTFVTNRNEEIGEVYVKIYSDKKIGNNLKISNDHTSGGAVSIHDGYIEMKSSDGKLVDYMSLYVKFPKNTFDTDIDFWGRS